MACQYSVVIPTHNRSAMLLEVLRGLEAQQQAPPFEVIVVDDGSSDGTAERFSGFETGLSYRFVRQDNRGPAAARNRGVLEAHGDRVAFLGDDTVPEPGWLAAHHGTWVRLGAKPERAVIGYTGWHPRMRKTAFLRYINEYGLQFGYALIERPEDVPFNFFYTSNLALSKQRLLEEPFDLRFPYAAWEDIEASYRMFRRGLTLAYAAEAVVAHDHPTDLSRFADRQEKAGFSAVVFYRLHPELGSFLGLGADGPPPLPPGGRQRLLEWLVRALQKTPLSLTRWWEEVLRFHYIRGLHRGWHEEAGL
jgi:glycosyltransferase involved in cell wall biosynthesis